MNHHLLEVVNASGRSSTLGGLSVEDERELIRLFGIDKDDLVYLLQLSGRGVHPESVPKKALFGHGRDTDNPFRDLWRARVLGESIRHAIECVDAYEVPLTTPPSDDPGVRMDIQMVENLCATHHRECRSDEVFVGNVDVELGLRMTYQTARLGKTAYSDTGKRLSKKFRPLFVARAEIIEQGLPEDARQILMDDMLD